MNRGGEETPTFREGAHGVTGDGVKIDGETAGGGSGGGGGGSRAKTGVFSALGGGEVVGTGCIGFAESVEIGFVLFFGGEGDVGNGRGRGLRGSDGLHGALDFDPFPAFDIGGELDGEVNLSLKRTPNAEWRDWRWLNYLVLIILRKIGRVPFGDRHAAIEALGVLKEILTLLVATFFHTLDFVGLERVHCHGADERNVDPESSMNLLPTRMSDAIPPQAGWRWAPTPAHVRQIKI